MPPFLYLLWENTRFIFNNILIKKPFLSILYICHRSILYYLNLCYRSLKYSEYLKVELAYFLYVFILDAHYNTRLISYLLINYLAYDLPTYLLAILEVKL